MATVALQPPAPAAPTGLLLPGGCYIRLDNVGLPAGPQITHSHGNLCCGNNRDEWYTKYLCVWKGKYAQQQFGINSLQASEMACGMIRDFKIEVPVWLKPIVNVWEKELEQSPGFANKIKRNNHRHRPY